MVGDMRYRTLGKTNEKISVLGFDTAYLPRVETEIDRKKSDEILNYGIENGMNLIDTAYSYPAEELFKGVSGEEYLGNFLLENSLRKDLFISSKMPSHLINKKDDLEDIFNKQLKNLKTDYIDFYSLDGLNEKYWNMYKTMDIYEFMDDLLSDGHIKHIGFSTNTEMDMIVDICDDYDKWEFAITELSYLTERYQSGIEGVEYISKLNCGVMAKNPLRGGGLIKNIPSEIKELWDFIEEERSPRELAFDYLFDKKEISTVLTEANTLEDLKENIKIASNSKIDCLSKNDKDLIKEIVWEYKTRKANDCSECTHCMPCPQGVDIPGCFREYNLAKMLDNPKASAVQYYTLDEKTRADKCTHCGECLRFCTQMINISKDLQDTEDLFKDFELF